MADCVYEGSLLGSWNQTRLSNNGNNFWIQSSLARRIMYAGAAKFDNTPEIFVGI
jgi:hypothetical protein